MTNHNNKMTFTRLALKLLLLFSPVCQTDR